MKTKKNLTKKVLFGVCSFLAVSCIAIGGASLTSTQKASALEQSDIVAAVEGYTSILPEGVRLGEYTVLDVEATTIASMKQYDMGTHQALRFQYDKTGTPYAIDLGVYNKEGTVYQPSNSGYFNLWNGNNNTITGYIFKEKTAVVNGKMPTWVERADTGVYNIEYGGIKCYDENNAYAGEYYYVEVDGCIISEYFHANTNAGAITTNKFTIRADAAITIAPYATGKDISASAYAEISTTEFAGSKPAPVVYNVVEKEDKNYVQVINPKYYDVTYTDNTETLTGVATITFKDKYAGSVTANYTIKEIPEMGKLSQGASLDTYTVKEVLATDSYTTPTVISNPLVGYKLVGDGESVLRMNVKNVACSGNLVISAKATGLYKAYFYANIGLGGGTWNDALRGYISFYERRNDLNRKMANPTFLDWANGVNVEIGVLDIINGDGAFSGVYYYLELNGVRVFDGVSYQVADIQNYNMGSDFYIGLNGSSIELAPFEKLTVNETDSCVEIQDNVLDFDAEGNVKTAPVLKYTRMIGEYASCSPLTENDYDIAYDLDKDSGKCTITATMKGKFNEATVTKVVDYTQDVTHTVTVQDANGTVIDTKAIVEGETYQFPTTGVSDLIGWSYADGLYPLGYEIVVDTDVTIQAVCLDVDVVDGASVRISNANGYYGGMRFTVKVNTAQAAALGNQVSVHGLLIPTDLIEGDFDINEAGVQDKVLENGVEANGITTYYITLTEIRYHNFNRMYSARAYASVTYANGDVASFATEYTEKNNARSPYAVAVKAHNDTQEYSKYDKAQKDILDSYIQFTVQLNENYEVLDDVVMANYTVSKETAETTTLSITFTNIPDDFKAYNKLPVSIWKNGQEARMVCECTWNGNVAIISNLE